MKKLSLSQRYQSCLDFIDNHQQKVDHWQHWLTIGVILFILMWGIHIAKQPITLVQQQELVRLSQDYLYPRSQAIAHELLQKQVHQQQPIYRYQYFHFLRVIHDESQRLTIEEELKWEKKERDSISEPI